MDCRDAFYNVCCSLLIMLCNRQNIAEYEVYWLIGFPIINSSGLHFTSIFYIFSVMARWIAEMPSCCSLLIMLVTD